MKIKTKLTAILLSAAQAVLFSACSNSEDLPMETKAAEEITFEVSVTEAVPEPITVIHKAGEPVEPAEPDEYGIDWEAELINMFRDDAEKYDIAIVGNLLKEEELKDRWDLREIREKRERDPSLQQVFEELNISGFDEMYDDVALMVSVFTHEPTDVSPCYTDTPRRSYISAVLNGEEQYSKYRETDLSFEGFYNQLLEVMTPEFANSLIDGGRFYRYGDRLFVICASKGGDLSVVHSEYELTERTDTEIVITEVCYCIDYDNCNDLTYYPEKKDEYEKDYINNKFVLTENGWRCDFFSIDRPGIGGPTGETVKKLMA